MEDYLSALIEKLDRTSLTNDSLQLDEKREEDRSGFWFDYIEDRTSTVPAIQPENTVNFEEPNFFTTGLPSIPEFHGNSGHRWGWSI